jgi:hypothetical protein
MVSPYDKYITIPSGGDPGSVGIPSRGKGDVIAGGVVDQSVLFTAAGQEVRVPDLDHRTAALSLQCIIL